MKSLFLMLVAALGITAGAASLSSSAFASNVHLYPPSQENGQG
jgi:hypothetical protein